MIELLVGMLVSLICMLAIMAAFAVFEGKKRTTTTGNDAQQNGSYGLYELERQLRTAGSGIVQGYNWGLWGCPVTAFTGDAQTLPVPRELPSPFKGSGWPRTARVVPALVAAGNDNTPDVIGVVAGNSALQVFKIAVSSTPSVRSVVVGNSFGIMSGDYLLGTLPDGTCALAQLTNNTSTATQVTSTTLALNGSNSPTTGLNNATSLFDMGGAPAFTLFGIDPASNALVSYDLLQRPVDGNAATVTPIADGIVQMKVLYGIGNSQSNAVSKWVKPVGNWSIAALTANTAAAQQAMSQIKAIRVAIVAQSRLPERASDYSARNNFITLFQDLDESLRYKVTTQTQFRYQVYDTTIPIRNALVPNHF